MLVFQGSKASRDELHLLIERQSAHRSSPGLSDPATAAYWLNGGFVTQYVRLAHLLLLVGVAWPVATAELPLIPAMAGAYIARRPRSLAVWSSKPALISKVPPFSAIWPP